jgi:hypothetical protein
MAPSGPEIEPLGPSSRAVDTEGNGEAQMAQFQPERAMPERAISVSLERSRTGQVFQDVSRGESGPRPGRDPGQIRSGNELNLKLGLRPDLAIGPAPRQETATLATGELATATARPVAPNLPPTPQPDAGPPSEPVIRVTIGRVEVRAVFPEQPAKHSAPPRFRPSVTLDDYLNRGSGAKR